MRLAILLALLALSGVSSSAQRAQTPRRQPAASSLAARLDFDARASRLLSRDSSANVHGASRQKSSSAVAGKPDSAGISLPLAGSRYTFNTFGRPKLLFKEQGEITAPGAGSPEDIARRFLRSNPMMFGLRASEVDGLELVHQLQTGGFQTSRFQQTLHGIRVFQGYARVTTNEQGQVIGLGVDQLISQLELETVPRLAPAQALAAACQSLDLSAPQLFVELAAPRQGVVRYRNPYGEQLVPISVELVIFPLGPHDARLAYRLLVEPNRHSRYEILVDAHTGDLLYRHSLAHSIAQARVWTRSPLGGPREAVTFPDLWLSEGITKGNNADVYRDASGDNQPDSDEIPGLQNGRAFSESRVFDFPDGTATPRQDPRTYSAAAVTNLFYFVNRAHDYFYDLGFTEANGNFQDANFGRGGMSRDPVIAEAQDPASPGGEGFISAEDGVSPRLQIGIIAIQQPAEGGEDAEDQFNFSDGAYDGSVIFHEYAHGVVDRLVGGPSEVSCLAGGVQSTALAEGWADYFAISFFDDPVVGAYLSQNPERGFRRQSYDRNTFTYANFGDEGFIDPHKEGEIWAATLWDLRREIGKAAADRLIFDAIGLTPCDPSFIDARDAILMADKAQGQPNRAAIWRVFAARGMGNSAAGKDGITALLAGVVFNAAFDLPPDLQGGNRNPNVTSVPSDEDAVVNVGESWGYVVAASDPDGDALHFELTEAPSGMTIDAQGGQIRWTAEGFTGPRVIVTVTDGRGGSVRHGFIVRTLTPLSLNQRQFISAPRASVGLGVLRVDDPTPRVLQATLRGDNGNPELLLIGPSASSSGASARSGANETLSRSGPSRGDWVAGVVAGESYENVALTVDFPTPREIAPGAGLNGLSRPVGDESFFEVNVPDGTPRLSISTRGGQGNVDVYLMKDRVPVCQHDYRVSETCVFDAKSENPGNVEVIEVIQPLAGRWYFTLLAAEEYSGVDFLVSTTNPVSVSVVTGDGQGGLVNATLPFPLSVEVRDRAGAPLPGVAVTFAVASGTAVVSPAIAPTGPDGRASAGVRLGGVAGPVTVTATVAGLTPANFNLVATALPPAEISPGGVVLATLTPFVITISPGSIFSLFGDRFAQSGGVVSNPAVEQGRVATVLAETCVEVNGVKAPVFAVSRTQINAQTPDIAAGGQASIVVVRGCGSQAEVRSEPAMVPVAAATPAFFKFFPTLSGNDPIAALHQDGVSFVGPPTVVMEQQFTPARPGEIVSLFATGLGPTEPPLAAGDIPQLVLSGRNGLATVALPIEITIGGVVVAAADTLYVGAAPCCAGLFQVVVRVPDSVADGNLPVILRVSGVSSPPGPFLPVAKP